MVAGDGTNADYEAFAVNDDNGGDLTSGNITIGAKDSGFNGATTFTLPGVGTPVGTFASGSFSITTPTTTATRTRCSTCIYVNY